MAFDNLPGIFDFKTDGNLGLLPANLNPVVLVLGTASKGPSDTVFSVARTSTAVKTFGKDGTLVRGALEATAAGALNLRVMRIGASPAVLADIGGGLRVETITKDDSAGTDYKIFWDESEGRLRIYRASDDELVYDNSPADPDGVVDLNEVAVSGLASPTVATAATGSITAVAGASLVDGELFVLNDGVNPPTIFEFELSPALNGVTAGNVAVVYTIADTAATVAATIFAAINGVGAGLAITATGPVGAVVGLANDAMGDMGNKAVLETVAAAGFVVTGMSGGEDLSADIGTLAVPITLEAADGVGGAEFTDGTDGLELSRMELWEALYNAYSLLEDVELDQIIPMNAYLDDKNIQDMTNAEVTAFNLDSPWSGFYPEYPIPGTVYDGLGKVYVQEFEGKFYFWWDMDRDGTAELFPAVGSASATTNIDGDALVSADFHEVNFAYDLARFCFDKSENNAEVIGFIGVRPPVSFSLADVSAWVGKAPVSALSGDNEVITENGLGLLGNKFMAGRVTDGSLPGLTIDGIDGLLGGGFYAKDEPWLDGAADLKDANDALVDLGKYISVIGAQLVLSNASQSSAYAATGAGAYSGFVSGLPPESAPTNKVLPGARLPFRLSLSKLDALAGMGYVMAQIKSKGVVVSDAPTGARASSDYRRLSTVRIVKAALDAVRSVADPFLGEGLTGARLAALETAIENALSKLLKAGLLKRYNKRVSSSPSDQVLGKATVELTLVPAFELRQITVLVNLAAQ